MSPESPPPSCCSASLSCRDGVPLVPLLGLDHLWFQITGTLCNLTCEHCFISASPTNHTFGMLSREAVEQALAESVALGVREYYFTGGEPFMHREIVEVLSAALALGPTTVLTNGMLFRGETLARLAAARDASIYSLEVRLSLDGPDAASNDALRGRGSFARAMAGVTALVENGFLPIITCTRTWELDREQAVLERFREALAAAGYSRPRLKVLPALRMGAEARRSGGYAGDDRVTPQMLEGFDISSLICTSARVITDRGVWVCPILLDHDDARMGDTLAGSTGSYALAHGACTTCWAYGSICTNSAVARGEG